MNYNSYTSPEADNQPNENYSKWQEAMKDVEFQGVVPSAPETALATATEAPEDRERRPRRSVSETIRILETQEMEHSGEMTLRPKAEIICDHDHIEDQRIDVINKLDQGKVEFKFKLRSSDTLITAIAERLEGGQTEMPSGAKLGRGQFIYEGTEADKQRELCDAFILEKDGVRVTIADPTARNGDGFWIASTCNDSKLVRTAIGLVKAEVPSDMEPEETEKTLSEIFEQDLGVPNALSEVSETAEKEYKIARYKWQYAIQDELTPEQTERAEKLSREEVFPGYTTLVEKGKHQEYLEKYGEDVRAYHKLNTGSAKSIYRALTQGLMSTTERYSRGMIRNGSSSATDMDTGGADSVFTRVADQAHRGSAEGTLVVLKPEVFDRTDWYAYDDDTYGSTDTDSFARRMAPDELFNAAVKGPYFPSGNEQMFRTGIGANFIESIEVSSSKRDKFIAQLHEMGLSEVGGRPIEEIIVGKVRNMEDFTDFVAQDEAEKVKQLAEYKAKVAKEQAEKQAKMQAIISGEAAYTSMDEVMDLANAGEDFNASFKAIAEAIVAQGGKAKFAEDVATYLTGELEMEELEALANGVVSEGYTEEDKEMFSYLQDVLGVNYAELYKKALESNNNEEQK